MLTEFEKKMKDVISAKAKRFSLYRVAHNDFFKSVGYPDGISKYTPALRKAEREFEIEFNSKHPKVKLPVEYFYDLRQSLRSLNAVEAGWYKKPKLFILKEKEYNSSVYWHAEDYESLGKVIPKVFAFLTEGDGYANWGDSVGCLKESVQDYKNKVEKENKEIQKFDDSTLKAIDPEIAKKVQEMLEEKQKSKTEFSERIQEDIRLLDSYQKACKGDLMFQIEVLENIHLYDDNFEISIVEYKN